MNFKSSERPWLVGGVLGGVVLLALAWFFAIGPELSKAATVRSAVGDAQTQNSVLQARTSKLKAEAANLPQYRQQLKGKLAQLPVEAQFTELTVSIQNDAKLAGVNVSTFDFGQPTAIAGANKTYSIPLTMETTGSMSRQRQFLRLVQLTGPRAALVASVDFKAAGGQALTNLNVMTAQATVYWTPMTQAAADALQKQLEDAAGAGN